MQSLLSPEIQACADPLNQLPCPVLVTDLHGRMLAANADLLAVVGGTEAQWLQQAMDVLLPRPAASFCKPTSGRCC